MDIITTSTSFFEHFVVNYIKNWEYLGLKQSPINLFIIGFRAKHRIIILGFRVKSFDFIISKGNKIIPLEVKSGNYKNRSSIDKFKNKFSKRVSDKIVLHSKDLRVKGDTIYLPLYMAIFIE